MDTNGNYIQNQFCSYEIALKLKELGFDEKCVASYYTYDIKNFSKGKYDYRGKFEFDYSTEDQYIVNSNETYYVSAPLWQQTITWIENVYNITIEISRNKYFDTFMKSWAYQALIKVFNKTELTTSYFVRDKMNNTIFYSYEDAREQAILKALKLILNETHNE